MRNRLLSSAPADRSRPESAEEEPERHGPTADEIASDQRHQSLDRAGRKAEHEPARQDVPDYRRHGDVSKAGAHRDRERLGRECAGRTIRSPTKENEDQSHIAEGIHGERCRRSGGCDDEPAKGRPDAPREIEAHAVERDRVRQFHRGTMSPTDDCQAGPLRALPHPIKNVKNRRSHGVTRPK